MSLGVPFSFLGAITLMPGLDVPVNEVSLFAFVLVLGIVVDDAIIVHENHLLAPEEHGDGVRGSVEGAHETAKPVTFAVLTTLGAFSPLLFVPACAEIDWRDQAGAERTRTYRQAVACLKRLTCASPAARTHTQRSTPHLPIGSTRSKRPTVPVATSVASAAPGPRRWMLRHD